MSKHSPLFTLPTEVRYQIYNIYLSHDHDSFMDTLQPKKMFFDDIAPHSRPLPALMLTCKSIYMEMSSAVHERAVMRVEMHRRADRYIGFAVYGPLRFSSLRKLWLMVQIEYPNWNSWLYFFRQVLERAPNLETLVIDWKPRPVSNNDRVGRVNMKKEDEFFQMIGALEKLHTLRIHGNISPRWIGKLREEVVCVVHDPCRWWREPGLDL
ncbi:hypothetical protein F5Y16DRAFT_406743 [Xylariaceae sp. FL0255]|nr:hypothetical protein F5Y16DRAFT_406743 [Xylariaceae sp. FL0255]